MGEGGGQDPGFQSSPCLDCQTNVYSVHTASISVPSAGLWEKEVIERPCSPMVTLKLEGRKRARGPVRGRSPGAPPFLKKRPHARLTSQPFLPGRETSTANRVPDLANSNG